MYLRSYITNFSTYISTLAVFLPVFGTYVGIVVQDLKVEEQRSSRKASSSFIYIIFALLAAYCVGIILVVKGFTSGFIQNEQSLPAAVAIVEASFGAFLTTCFFKLFKEETKNP